MILNLQAQRTVGQKTTRSFMAIISINRIKPFMKQEKVRESELNKVAQVLIHHFARKKKSSFPILF